MKLVLILLASLGALNADAQQPDTVFYHNKSILYVRKERIENNQHEVYILLDQQGKNLLSNGDAVHRFFDSGFNKKRVIKISNHLLIEDYCVSESDTVYNYIPYTDEFDQKLKQLYAYLEDQVIYPKNALKKGIEAQVKLSLIIDVNGAMTQITALSKHEWGFEEAVIRALNNKKFFGFVAYKSQPVKYYLEFPFAFKIHKK